MKASHVRLPLTVLGLALATVLPGLACSQGTEQVNTGVDAIIFTKRAFTTVDPSSVCLLGDHAQAGFISEQEPVANTGRNRIIK